MTIRDAITGRIVGHVRFVHRDVRPFEADWRNYSECIREQVAVQIAPQLFDGRFHNIPEARHELMAWDLERVA